MTQNKESGGPLHGIRILDLTAMVSGPVATMMLADQGAEVIKVEPPQGDIMRHFGTMHNGMSASFLSCNRSKKSLCLDLKTEGGLEIVKKLITTADVFVQNFRPGTIERIGLSEDIVRALNPSIVFVSISGFGETGPYAHKRVYDPVIQALSGLADIQANRDNGQPRMIRTIIPDKTTAVTAAQAITAALFARERTGDGQHVRLSMLDTMIAYLWPEASSSLSFVGNERDPAQGQMGLDLVFQTQDGYITAGAVSDSEWAGMCRAFNREELIKATQFLTVEARRQNFVARRKVMADEIAKWTTREILARFDQEGVPSAPILDRMEVLENDQVRVNKTIEIVNDEVLGGVRQPRPAAQFSKTPAEIKRLAPMLGADNKQILGELGYSAQQIASLIDTQVLHRSRSPQ